jgi:two-component system, chemotaxis family, CheB/CheR fusion protein
MNIEEGIFRPALVVAEHGRIYVIPPNTTPTITRGRIRVTPAAGGVDCPADTLFTSLAQEFGDKAIGVTLSGGGSDRALGIRAIRRAGGTTFAQYPGSARFPNLPISAIDTGCVNYVLRPNEIAHELTSLSRHKEKAPRGAFSPKATPGRGHDSRRSLSFLTTA